MKSYAFLSGAVRVEVDADPDLDGMLNEIEDYDIRISSPGGSYDCGLWRPLRPERSDDERAIDAANAAVALCEEDAPRVLEGHVELDYEPRRTVRLRLVDAT